MATRDALRMTGYDQHAANPTRCQVLHNLCHVAMRCQSTDLYSLMQLEDSVAHTVIYSQYATTLVD